MAELLTHLLDVLGRQFYKISFVCVALMVLAVLLGRWKRRRYRRCSSHRENRVSGDERAMLQAITEQQDELWILLRRADYMPVSVVGNLELLGVTFSQLQGDIACLLTKLKSPEEGRKFWESYRTYQKLEPLYERMELADGQWISVSVYPSAEGKTDLFAVRQVTREHQRENKYIERLHQAEKASQFKTSFLFRMSHEIRTPINGITGTLMLAESKLPEEHEAMQYLTKTNELTAHLLELVNDILDMARIEAGKIELEKAPFSLRTLGGRLYDMYAGSLEAAGIRYEVNYEEMTVDWVLGDELRISQIILNFLSNAVKFTKEGEIILTFRQMLLQNGRVDLLIRVHDTGVGMKAEFIDRIFHPFEQEDISTTRKFGGTGLGMTITDHLVKLMGGQIVVDSLQGKGSDFTVFLSLPTAEAPETELPKPEGAEKQAEEAKKAEQPAQLSGRILLAEDNEINAMIVVEILKTRGLEVEVAENGQIAVEHFVDHPEGYYDLILMDIQMPVMDGRTAARTIRGLKRGDAARIPIYALSADAFVEDERLSRESGMDGHLTKPIDYDKLWKIIEDGTKGKETE